MSIPENGTPEWWRDRLLERYRSTDLPSRNTNASFYDSINPSPETLDKYAAAYRRLLQMSKTPWGRLSVDIVAERLSIVGVKIGAARDADEDAWELLRRNRIKALQRALYREGLALGTSYLSIWPDERLGTKFAFESAMAVNHETAPGDPNDVMAAQKIWHDPIKERVRLNVFTKKGIVKYQSDSRVTEEAWVSPAPSGSIYPTRWETLEEIDNPYDDRVPMIPFVVRPNWEGYGQSDLEDLRPIISRIENLTANTLLATELGAFRVRWATGLDIPVDEDGKAIEPFQVALDRVWVSGDEKTKFGSFDATDIRPYLQAISDGIGQLSAVSRIPTLYFNQSELSNPPSAASLEAAEVGLIERVEERQDRFAESWETAMRMALDTDADVHVVWDDPRNRSEAQKMDAALKLHSIGVPFQGILEFLGYDPTEVKRMMAMRSADTFDRLLNTPLNANQQGRPVPQQLPAGGVEQAE